MTHHLDEFDDERRWLRPPPRQRRRLLLGLSLVAVLTLVSLALGGRSEVPPPPDPGPPPRPTADQRALEAGRRALQAWGRFALTNQLGTLRGWFWPNGPQYRQLVHEAKLRRGNSASQVIVYPDAPHAFYADYRPSYRPEAADDGWQRLR